MLSAKQQAAWGKKAQKVVDAVAAYGGYYAAARHLGIPPTTVQAIAARAAAKGIKAAVEEKEPPPLPTVDLLKAVPAAIRRQPISTKDLSARLDVSEADIKQTISDLQDNGVSLHEVGGRWEILQPQAAHVHGPTFEFVSDDNNRFMFGATSDNHRCNKNSRLDVLNDLYDRFERANVQAVFNAGNWIDGEARFNKHELLVHGLDNQLAYLAANYPRRGKIKTYAVAGDDHEGWYAQREGVDIGRYAEMKMKDAGRDDWVNLGYMEAHVRLVNKKTKASSILAVVHPGGGSAYAISYTVQKIVESLDGGEKPAVGLYGHYHKLMCANVRNVWTIQTGCFLGGTYVETDAGRKRIKDIKVGDRVLTHRGRYRKVWRLFKKMHSGDMVSINYGRKGRCDQTITSTPEHPILVERADGERLWLPAHMVREGDQVFVQAVDCRVTGQKIPYWMRLSREANPMDDPASRAKLSKTKGGFRRIRKDGAAQKHLEADVLPVLRELQADGWRVVPVGGAVVPDAIGFKDGKVVAFEVEKATGNYREFKVAKYAGSVVAQYVDEVKWVFKSDRKVQPRSWYAYDPETGMCKVKVVGVKRRPVRGAHSRKKVTVYNLSVEDDESYVASKVAVHNCTEDQTTFMRKKKIDAHVGGVLFGLEQDPDTGAIIGCSPEMIRYFVKGYYQNRWSLSGGVQQAERGR